jgi:hypothetical protein
LRNAEIISGCKLKVSGRAIKLISFHGVNPQNPPLSSNQCVLTISGQDEQKQNGV